MPPAIHRSDISQVGLTKSSSNDIIVDKKWCQSFPPSLTDETSSSRFMARAMFVAFSCALRYRKIFGEECFNVNYITEKLKMRSLSFDNPASLEASQLLRAAGEAIKDGALEECALVVTNKEGDVEALEVFSWKMHYDEHNNPSAEFRIDNSPFGQLSKIAYNGSTSVRDQLVMLVRSLQVICQKCLTPLPDDISVNFRLSYMDHIDSKYEVDGFEKSTKFYELPEDCQTASLGQLRPGHHGCDLSCSSVFMNDAYETELVLKRYSEKMAESLGYNAPNTLYQSFVSENNVSQMSIAVAVTPENMKQKDDDDLADEVESVRLKDTPVKPVNRRGRKKRSQEAPVSNDDVPQAANFARVSTVTTITPEKRSRRE